MNGVVLKVARELKYLTTQASDEEDSLSQLKGINQIQTPLFNPNNLSDDNKLNALIRQNFSAKNGEKCWCKFRKICKSLPNPYRW